MVGVKVASGRDVQLLGSSGLLPLSRKAVFARPHNTRPEVHKVRGTIDDDCGAGPGRSGSSRGVAVANRTIFVLLVVAICAVFRRRVEPLEASAP
jgi:hypothetical protein